MHQREAYPKINKGLFQNNAPTGRGGGALHLTTETRGRGLGNSDVEVGSVRVLSRNVHRSDPTYIGLVFWRVRDVSPREGGREEKKSRRTTEGGKSLLINSGGLLKKKWTGRGCNADIFLDQWGGWRRPPESRTKTGRLSRGNTS